MRKNFGIAGTTALVIASAIGFQNCSDFSVADGFGLSVFGSSSSSPVGQIRRLSAVEFQNSLQDILTAQFGRQGAGNTWHAGLIGEPAVQNSLGAMPSDTPATKLGTPELAVDLNEDFFSGYNNVAIAIASSIVTHNWVPNFISCATDSTTVAPACADQFITEFATLAFRNPPTPEERLELKTSTDWTSLIARILAHPRFLTHIERGGQLQKNGTYLLTAYEIEARMAQIYLKSAPDVAGLQAVSSGSLSTAAGIRAEAARLFALARSRDVMWAFYQQWLGAKRLPFGYGSDDPAYNAFSAPLVNSDMNAYPNALRNAVLDDARMFLDYQTFNGGSLSDVFKSPLIFTTNSMVATIYGVSPRANTSAPPITDTTGHYGGILSRPIITQQDPGSVGDTNHIQRGVLIMTNIVGLNLGLPAAAALQQAAATQIPAGASSRTEQSLQTHGASCQQCHSMINPAGFALANFDSLGRYQAVEKRYRNVNNAASIIATNSVDATAVAQFGSKFYPVSSLPDLVNALLDSGKVAEGFATYYFMYSFGRLPVSPNDVQLLNAFEGDLKTKSLSDALLNLSLSPFFSIAAPPQGGS